MLTVNEPLLTAKFCVLSLCFICPSFVLADSIFVRVYESRMDLLRAVIVGAEGTPYHDGLFFFDVFFPTGYPKVPPVCD